MPHKPLQTYDRKMKRFVTASESKAVTAEGISNIINNTVTVTKDSKTTNNSDDFDTLASGLRGQVYYVRVRVGVSDSTGNCIYGPWSNVERASKTISVDD
ncbi:hypothetical protein [Butyrivibrio sp. MC2013]|uniref:hypothetical protein n=1 Tax=Butyrivibrio sp. MC2013 TaxID=1280686 RepID=UPI00047E5C8E|nr:hypothetical protein [Butyrivibrio sp. MC2013]